MSLTKIGSIGINTGIQLAGVTTVSTLHVGSGVTLSSDGDGFFTGIITATFAGDGTSLTGVASTDNIRTNTNATFLQNINVSGTVTASSFGGPATQVTVSANNSTDETVYPLFVDGTGNKSPEMDTSLTYNPSSNNLSAGTFVGDISGGATGDFSIADKIVHTGDTNTAIRFPLNDEFSVETFGSERLRIEPLGNVKVNQNLSVSGIATVGSAVTISESGIEASGIGITVANINGGQIGGRRNLVINGAMEVAQRGTSSTSDGFHTIDRFATKYGGEDEAPTFSQSDVASGTTPYTLGFRKTLKVTNGNQTGGADSGDYMFISYKFEAKDLAVSGWNYTSTSSFVTLSFWVKSSVAQTFYGYLRTTDGTSQNFRFETGSLSANTWKKVVVKVPGAANIQFDHDNGEGLEFVIATWFGTTYTAQALDTPLETWAAFASGTRMRDMTNTWYNTNDATFEITGVQLEVGSQATPFEHRSFGEELSLCQRYYQRWKGFSDHNGIGAGRGNGSSGVFVSVNLIKCLRATPSVTNSGIVVFKAGASSTSTSDTPSLTNASAFDNTSCMFPMNITGLSGITNNYGGYTVFLSGSDLQLDAEM